MRTDRRPSVGSRVPQVGLRTAQLPISRLAIPDPRLISSAFTLVEVMVALLIFFMAVFTILGLISNSLRNARALQRKQVDCGQVAAQVFVHYSSTNQIPEGEDSGDFGDMFPDHHWTTDTNEVEIGRAHV